MIGRIDNMLLKLIPFAILIRSEGISGFQKANDMHQWIIYSETKIIVYEINILTIE